MASMIRQRLRRFNGTDYDTIHLETNADNVLYGNDTVKTSLDTLHSTKISKVIGPTGIASFNDGESNAMLNRCIVNIEPVQTGRGDPSPTNVRPISGWTGAKVSTTGKNLIDQSVSPYFTGRLLDEWIMPLHDNIVPQLNKMDAGIYTVSVSFILSDSTSVGIFGFYALNGGVGISCYLDNTPIEGGKKTIVTATFEITEQMVGNFDGAWIYAGNTSSITPTTYTELQIERGAAPTEYEPFGTNYTITFPSEAGTVYGGTLDAETGKLVVDYRSISLSSFTPNIWTYHTDGRSVRFNNVLEVSRRNVYGFCSHANINIGTDLKDGDIRIGIDDKNVYWAGILKQFNLSLDEFKEWITTNDVQLVYELVTPITYQLTPVQVRTLLGLNNIYADCGDITVGYNGYI